MATKSQAEIAQEVTDRIIDSLENGVAPWDKPWQGAGALPRNGVTGRHYNGINLFLLDPKFEDPRWITRNQARKMGATILRSAEPNHVVFWKPLRIDDPKAKKGYKVLPFMRLYEVFNVEQIVGAKKVVGWNNHTIRHAQKIEACELLLSYYTNRPSIYHDGGDSAFYVPFRDTVHMPKQGAFKDDESYYGTLWHELTHSTGHSKRLKRQGIEAIGPFGSESYSKEELVAEIGSAILCSLTGIDKPEVERNQEAYIANWLKRLQGDTSLIIRAAAEAQKAVNHITKGRDITVDPAPFEDEFRFARTARA